MPPTQSATISPASSPSTGTPPAPTPSAHSRPPESKIPAHLRPTPSPATSAAPPPPPRNCESISPNTHQTIRSTQKCRSTPLLLRTPLPLPPPARLSTRAFPAGIAVQSPPPTYPLTSPHISTHKFLRTTALAPRSTSHRATHPHSPGALQPPPSDVPARATPLLFPPPPTTTLPSDSSSPPPVPAHSGAQ